MEIHKLNLHVFRENWKLYSKIWRYYIRIYRKKRKKMLYWEIAVAKKIWKCKKTWIASKQVLESRIKNLEVICVPWNLNIRRNSDIKKLWKIWIGFVEIGYSKKKGKRKKIALESYTKIWKYHVPWNLNMRRRNCIGKFCWLEIGNTCYDSYKLFFKLLINFHNYY